MVHPLQWLKANKKGVWITITALILITIIIVLYFVFRKNEGFQASNTTTTPMITLSDAECASKCGKTSLVKGFRSLYSGATFKMEQMSSSTPNTFFICGPGKYVVTRVQGSNSLQLGIRDTSSRTPEQLFLKEAAKTVDGKTCIVFQASGSNGLYVQYEHEHLSLRPLASDSTAYMGQAFVEYNVPESELQANALALGISPVRIGNEELYGAGYETTIAVPEGVDASAGTTSSDLASEIDLKYATALSGVMEAIQQLKDKIPEDRPAESAFGVNKPVEIRLDVSGLEKGKEGFQDASGSGTTSVKELVDQYMTASQSMQLGGVPLVGDELASSRKLLEIRQALQSKFKGCPNIDRNLFYNEKQLAQCSGCNPDAFLRGQLGGI